MEELTRVAPENPVCIWRSDSHSATMNRKAAEILGIYPGQPGADVDEAGKLTGVVRGLANSKAAREIYSATITYDLCEKAYHAAARQALRMGITTIGALVGGAQTELSTTWLIQNMGSLPVRAIVFDQTLDIWKVKERGLTRIGGCLLIDGSLGSYTAALYESYSDLPESTGVLYWKDEDLNRFIRQAHEAGLQIGVHAIGDRAIDQILNAYEISLRESPRTDHRHRIEHFLVPTPEAIRRAIDLGLVLAMQPAFEYFWGGSNNLYELRLGPERAKRVNPIGSILKKGGRIAGGSDSFVTPMDPLLGIHSAVNHPNEAERIPVYQAIDLFTRTAAYATFDEKEKGEIREGYLGDLVVLAEDPLKARPETIKDIKVLMTVVGGKIAYRNTNH
jgi:predicted amidohydrolase YtcJ